MKKTSLLYVLMTTTVLIFFACKKDTGNGNGSGDSLTITLSKTTLSLTTPETITITVKDQTNTDVTSSCVLTCNGATLSSKLWTPTTSGTFNFIATKSGITSNTATAVVVATSTAIDSLTVSFAKDTIEFDGFDSTLITVKDINGTDVTSSAKIYVSSVALTSNSYIALSASNVPVFAIKGSQFSKAKTLYVKTPSASPFTKKILLEDFTGTWCGYCPRVGKEIEDYVTTHTNTCIPIAVHGYSGTSDPFIYQYESQLGASFNVSGYPTAILNRKSTWDEVNGTLNTELAKWAPLGLSITSGINGTNVTGTVSVKYNVSTSKSMKIVVALVENGLVKDQTNYYSTLYNGANPVIGFVHNNILRRAATDIFGDAIPATAQVKNNVWDFQFSIPLSGTTGSGSSYTAVGANCKIVAYVIDGTPAKKGAYNVQSAMVGTTKNFD